MYLKLEREKYIKNADKEFFNRERQNQYDSKC